MKIIQPLFFLIIILNSSAQNLVLNPSFENHLSDKCLVNLGGFDRSILDWSIPNHGSTDFFDSCSKVMGIKNYNGFQNPKTGSSYVGMSMYTDKNYREYIQGQLSETLVKGKKYRMTFFLSLADKSSYALKDIQVITTEEKLKPCYHSNNCDKAITPSKATKKKFKIYSNTDDIYFSNKESWMEYSFEFIAEGYENYFSIGNFYRNAKTQKQRVLSTSEFYFSYYYIDDVSIVSTEKEEIKPSVNIAKDSEIKTNEIYAFKTILFEFDKAELLEASNQELNQLLKYLSKNTELNIEIYGHTDSIGLENRNKELSELRAKAVADYLILQGLDSSRITSFGFGSVKPISDNNTEEGQQKNRRVEFKLIEH